MEWRVTPDRDIPLRRSAPSHPPAFPQKRANRFREPRVTRRVRMNEIGLQSVVGEDLPERRLFVGQAQFLCNIRGLLRGYCKGTAPALRRDGAPEEPHRQRTEVRSRSSERGGLRAARGSDWRAFEEMRGG